MIKKFIFIAWLLISVAYAQNDQVIGSKNGTVRILGRLAVDTVRVAANPGDTVLFQSPDGTIKKYKAGGGGNDSAYVTMQPSPDSTYATFHHTYAGGMPPDTLRIVSDESDGGGGSSGATPGLQAVTDVGKLTGNWIKVDTTVKIWNGNNRITTNFAIGDSNLRANTIGARNSAFGQSALISNTAGNENTAIGNHALRGNTTAISNTAVGAHALPVSNANSNTAIGAYALNANTTGLNGVAVGAAALYVNTTGNQNTGVGTFAGGGLQTGPFNTAMGSSALQKAAGTSNRNVAIGAFALQNTLFAQYNTIVGEDGFAATAASVNYNSALGNRAGYNYAGDSSVFLGFQAGYSGSGNGRLYISNTSTNTPLIYGSFQRPYVSINGAHNSPDSLTSVFAVNSTSKGMLGPRMSAAQRLAIVTPAKGLLVFDNDSSSYFQYNGTAWQNLYNLPGGAAGSSNWTITGSDLYRNSKIRVGSTVAPVYTVDVEGDINIPTDLAYRINGVAVITAETATNSYFLGRSGNTTSSGQHNVATGSQALASISSGSWNSAYGGFALNSNSYGNSSSAFGMNALANATEGLNDAFGYQAGTGITLGTGNVAIGMNTLAVARNSVENTAVGNTALNHTGSIAGAGVGAGARNTGVGFFAGQRVQGSQNVAIGWYAMAGPTATNSVFSSTAVGSQALYGLSSGGRNTAIGDSAGLDVSSGSDNLIAGYGTALGLTTGSGNTILGGNVTGLSAALTNNIILADGTGTKRLWIDNTGRWKMSTGYGANAFVGTATYGLAVDASNNVITVPLSIAFSDGISFLLGKGLIYKAGAGQRAGNTTLGSGGTVNVPNTTVTANTLVHLTRKTITGSPGNTSYVLHPGVGFTISSDKNTDRSTFTYQLSELD